MYLKDVILVYGRKNWLANTVVFLKDRDALKMDIHDLNKITSRSISESETDDLQRNGEEGSNAFDMESDQATGRLGQTRLEEADESSGVAMQVFSGHIDEPFDVIEASIGVRRNSEDEHDEIYRMNMVCDVIFVEFQILFLYC